MAKECDSRKSGVDVAHATRDLVNSASRLSLAMGLFAARQATTLLTSPASKAVSSIDEVTNAASQHLTGIARTAFAVGSNLQQGLVDAAFDTAGLGARGEKPSGSTSGLAMSLTKSAERRMTGIRTVASGTLDRPVPQTEFVRRLNAYHAEATTTGLDCQKIVDSLWKSEGLATTIAKHGVPGNALDDKAIRREMLPVVHVGFGSGSAESLLFDSARLPEIFAERSAPNYEEFPYEGIGAILRAYERGLFKLMAGTLGLLPLDAADGPDPKDFFAEYLDAYPEHIQRLIAHGYGRLLAFSTIDIYEAVKEATAFPAARIEPVVHGAAFAFAMMNGAELPRLLRQSAIPFKAPVRAAFQNGLIYGLVFLDWYAPGVLEAWRPEGSLETELVDHARDEARLSAERGYPLAFRLAHPRA
ncbi:MAG TPA: hypothetical protein VF147_04540 [Vicinamibacterales bacterium]